MELVDAVQEIAMQETDTSWLAPGERMTDNLTGNLTPALPFALLTSLSSLNLIVWNNPYLNFDLALYYCANNTNITIISTTYSSSSTNHNPHHHPHLEYAEILRNQEAIRQGYKKRERSLEVLSGIVTDLYVDWHRLNGSDCRSTIGALQEVIMTTAGTDFDSLITAFFHGNPPTFFAGIHRFS